MTEAPGAPLWTREARKQAEEAPKCPAGRCKARKEARNSPRRPAQEGKERLFPRRAAVLGSFALGSWLFYLMVLAALEGLAIVLHFGIRNRP